jgi:8-oxo-dGTP pyrophosphatase MutT (NUDIX family)
MNIRKHQGIVQDGSKAGTLKKGYRYTGGRTSKGHAIISKAADVKTGGGVSNAAVLLINPGSSSSKRTNSGYGLNKTTVLILKEAKGAQSGKWSTPGGKLDSRESPSIGASRELKEETGISLKMGSSYYDIGGHTRLYIKIVNSEYNVKLSSEHSKYSWVTVGTLLKASSYTKTSYFTTALNIIMSKGFKFPT